MSNTINTSAGPLSRDDYITRAAAVYEAEGGLHLKQARALGGILADDAAEGILGRMTPEDAAREDMLSWEDSEGEAAHG